MDVMAYSRGFTVDTLKMWSHKDHFDPEECLTTQQILGPITFLWIDSDAAGPKASDLRNILCIPELGESGLVHEIGDTGDERGDSLYLASGCEDTESLSLLVISDSNETLLEAEGFSSRSVGRFSRPCRQLS